jgi:hypothetical protein
MAVIKAFAAGLKEGWNTTPTEEQMQSVARIVVRKTTGHDYVGAISTLVHLLSIEGEIDEDVKKNAIEWMED